MINLKDFHNPEIEDMYTSLNETSNFGTSINNTENYSEIEVKDVDIFGTYIDSNDTNYYNNGYDYNNNMLKETPNYNFNINDSNINDGWNSDFQFEIETRSKAIYSNTNPILGNSSTSRNLVNDDYNLQKKTIIPVNEYIKPTFDFDNFNVRTAFDCLDEVSFELFERVNRKSFENLSKVYGVKQDNRGNVTMLKS